MSVSAIADDSSVYKREFVCLKSGSEKLLSCRSVTVNPSLTRCWQFAELLEIVEVRVVHHERCWSSVLNLFTVSSIAVALRLDVSPVVTFKYSIVIFIRTSAENIQRPKVT